MQDPGLPRGLLSRSARNRSRRVEIYDTAILPRADTKRRQDSKLHYAPPLVLILDTTVLPATSLLSGNTSLIVFDRSLLLARDRLEVSLGASMGIMITSVQSQVTRAIRGHGRMKIPNLDPMGLILDPMDVQLQSQPTPPVVSHHSPSPSPARHQRVNRNQHRSRAKLLIRQRRNRVHHAPVKGHPPDRQSMNLILDRIDPRKGEGIGSDHYNFPSRTDLFLRQLANGPCSTPGQVQMGRSHLPIVVLLNLERIRLSRYLKRRSCTTWFRLLLMI
jgi:hypothetical protein